MKLIWGIHRTAMIMAAWLLATSAALAAMMPIADGDEVYGRQIRPHSQYLSASDVAIFNQAFDLCDRQQWDAARSLALSAGNPIVRRLVDWRYYSSATSGASFDAIAQFINESAGWPGMAALRGRAEAAMSYDMDAGQTIAWFGASGPVSGAGKFKFGDALIRKGERGRGENFIRKAWREGDLNDDVSTALLNRHGGLISVDDTKERLSNLLWQRKHAAAQGLFGRVDAGVVALATARIRLQTSARNAEEAYQSVPGAYRQDPGLLFDRARWLRKRDRDGEARLLLIQASGNMDGPAPDGDAWWDEINVLTREALDAGQIDTAYALAAGHKIRPQDNLVDFAEGEFLAGWIALQYQRKPDLALTHFKRLRAGVTAPISAARAHYWAGRALAKLGRETEAKAEFKSASEFSLTYYGQMALHEYSPKARYSVPEAAKPSDLDRFQARSYIAAIRALADIGDGQRLRAFALAAAEVLNDGAEYANLVAVMRNLGEQALAIRVSKRALQKNIALYDLSYPNLATPVYAGGNPAPETAIVLGLTRQESEFDPAAHSGSNARGLMQLIPSTARMTATRHGIAYSGADSLYNATLNMQLGMAHFGDLLDDFAGSYVMSIAAYNAGGGRVNEWVGRYGDPRAPGADAVDWIERIPFSETRNYVQRVLENIQVYRAILGGRSASASLMADIKRGTYATLASAQFTSAPTGAAPAPVGATGPSGAVLAATVRSMPVVEDEDEGPGAKPILEVKPKTAKGKSRSKKYAKAKKKSGKKLAAKKGKCAKSPRSAECRRSAAG
jgi:soluble lytic murein transglycosylase